MTVVSPALLPLCLVYVPDTCVTFLRCNSLCVETQKCRVCDRSDATLCLGDARNIRGIRIRVIARRSGGPWVRRSGIWVFGGPTVRGATTVVTCWVHGPTRVVTKQHSSDHSVGQ